MKKESVAETTLRQQVNRADAEIAFLEKEIGTRIDQKNALYSFKLGLESEIYRLQQARIHASQSRKPTRG